MTSERIDRINIGLIAIAFIAASLRPFETFILAYAYLGPLHYLTQISWLHDRKYFLDSRKQAIFLVAPAALWVASTIELYPFTYPSLALFAWVSLVSALCIVFATQNHRRVWLAIFLGFLGLLLTTNFWWTVLLVTLLPTIIHVFLFTAIFMLYGAMKSKSRTGVIAAFTLITFAILAVVFPVPGGKLEVTPYFRTSLAFFTDVIVALLSIFQFDTNDPNIYRVTRLLAFTYLYHYLNWFSKTKVIGWGEISKTRATAIVIAYGMLISIYAVDFAWGFLSAFTLATLHVFLEFPLNIRTMKGVFGGIVHRLSRLPTEARSEK